MTSFQDSVATLQQCLDEKVMHLVSVAHELAKRVVEGCGGCQHARLGDSGLERGDDAREFGDVHSLILPHR